MTRLRASDASFDIDTKRLKFHHSRLDKSQVIHTHERTHTNTRTRAHTIRDLFDRRLRPRRALCEDATCGVHTYILNTHTNTPNVRSWCVHTYILNTHTNTPNVRSWCVHTYILNTHTNTPNVRSWCVHTYILNTHTNAPNVRSWCVHTYILNTHTNTPNVRSNSKRGTNRRVRWRVRSSARSIDRSATDGSATRVDERGRERRATTTTSAVRLFVT